MAPPSIPPLLTFALAAQESYSHATIVTNGVEVLLKHTPWGLIVSFRGTDEARDVLTDVWSWPVRDPLLGWCHAGFLRGAREAWALLRDPLLSFHRSGVAIWLTGHSKGGAEASLFSGLMVAEGGMLPAGLVTFGAPRSGGWRLRELLTPVRQRRVVDQGDPVPHVPPPGLLIHPNAEIDRLLLLHPANLTLDHPIAAYVKLIDPETPAFLL